MLAKIAGGEPTVSLKPRVYVTMLPEVLQELKAYVEHYKTEVSGCGLVEKYELNDKDVHYIEFRVTEIFLPSEQSNSAASTDIDSKVIHQIMTDLLSQNKDTSKLKFHWHSHADMSVFHSSTDEENYDELNNGEYLISMVLNRKGDMFTSVHFYEGLGIDIEGVELYTFMPDADEKVADKIKKNIEKLDEHTKNVNPAWWEIEDERDKWKKWKKGKKAKYLFDNDNRDITEQEADAGDMVGLTRQETKELINCRSTNCLQCPKEARCAEFNGILANLEVSCDDGQKQCPYCGSYNYSDKATICWSCSQPLGALEYYD